MGILWLRWVRLFFGAWLMAALAYGGLALVNVVARKEIVAPLALLVLQVVAEWVASIPFIAACATLSLLLVGVVRRVGGNRWAEAGPVVLGIGALSGLTAMFPFWVYGNDRSMGLPLTAIGVVVGASALEALRRPVLTRPWWLASVGGSVLAGLVTLAMMFWLR